MMGASIIITDALGEKKKKRKEDTAPNCSVHQVSFLFFFFDLRFDHT